MTKEFLLTHLHSGQWQPQRSQSRRPSDSDRQGKTMSIFNHNHLCSGLCCSPAIWQTVLLPVLLWSSGWTSDWWSWSSPPKPNRQTFRNNTAQLIQHQPLYVPGVNSAKKSDKQAHEECRKNGRNRTKSFYSTQAPLFSLPLHPSTPHPPTPPLSSLWLYHFPLIFLSFPPVLTPVMGRDGGGRLRIPS